MTLHKLVPAALPWLFLATACSPPPVQSMDVAATDAVVVETGPMGEAGVCTRGAVVTPHNNMDTMCVGFTARPCEGASGDFCPRFVDNNPMRPKFVLTQIDIQQPPTLAPDRAIGRLLNTAIRNATFSWGIDIDFAAMTVRTGTMQQPIQRLLGSGYYNEALRFTVGGAPMPGTADRWNPVNLMITAMGDTVTTTVAPLITIPVYDEAMAGMLLTELPLRNARMLNLKLTAGRNCIGSAQPNFNSCGPTNNRWNTSEAMVPNGILEAVLTVADTRRIQVVSLSMPLCNLIAGTACESMGMPVSPDMFTNRPDTMIMVDGVMQPAWTLRANIAGVAMNIAN
ncbi:MAG: hypothetical protein Q8Q09_05160 [Deltaproteobacteria bacterium]|nr:hypothetical protein [Deltaproteobacteria bacterium]